MASNGDPERSHARTARYTALSFWLALVVAVVGFAGGGFVGRQTAPTETVTETVTVVEAPPPEPPGPDGSGARACAGELPTADDREPNDQPGRAGGPIMSGQPVEGEISTTNDLDYYATCVVEDAALQFELECLEAPDNDCSAYASFGGTATGAGSFEPGSPLGCTVSEPGRYYVLVQANDYPVTYRVTVDADPADALVSALEPPLDVAREPCY